VPNQRSRGGQQSAQQSVQEAEAPNEGPTLTTDQEDYPPYSYVYFTGTGFQPGESVNMIVVELDPVQQSFEPWDVVADENGNFQTSWYIFSEDLRGATMQATATGQSSQLTASATFTDGGVRIKPQDISSSSTFAWTTNVGAVNQTIYVQAESATTTHGYKLEAFDATGASKYLGPCRTGSTTISGDSYTPTTLSSDNSHQWTWTVHEWTGSDCSTGPQSEDNDNTQAFSVAGVTTYSDSSLTTLKTVFAPGDTVYLVVNGFIPGNNDAEVTWIQPDNTTACSNTVGGDRPNSDASAMAL